MFLGNFGKKQRETPSMTAIASVYKKKKELEQSYEGETKRRYEHLRADVEKGLNEAIEETDELERLRLANELFEHLVRFEKEIHDGEESWSRLKTRAAQISDAVLNFLQSTTYSPPTFIFEVNKIKGEMMEIEEWFPTNPLGTTENLANRAEKLEKDMDEFIQLHKILVELMETKGKEAKPDDIIHEKIQEIVVLLQRGELKKAKQQLKR